MGGKGRYEEGEVVEILVPKLATGREERWNAGLGVGAGAGLRKVLSLFSLKMRDGIFMEVESNGQEVTR